MDNAVALIESYLRVNGYLTVTEYPVVEAMRYGGNRTATDLDVLAFRFPNAGKLTSKRAAESDSGVVTYAPDPTLHCDPNQPDMLIGEVKEGRAEFNRAAHDPSVLQAVLSRFGCCEPGSAGAVVTELLRHGHAQTHFGHKVRLVVFGTAPGEHDARGACVVSLGHVRKFLQEFVQEHWDVLRQQQLKDPALGFLLMLEKANRGMV